MAASVCTSLGLDSDNLTDKLILISEGLWSDSTFLTVSLIWKAIQSGTGVYLLALQNSEDHYHNVAARLMCNLQVPAQNNQFSVLNAFKSIKNKFTRCENSVNVLCPETNDSLRDLFLQLNSGVLTMKKKMNSVYIIIDDISNLLSLGYSLKSVTMFSQYCRTLLSIDGVTLIIGTHYIDSDQELCVLYKTLYCASDICISVAGLKTGFSSDVSGSIKVIRKYLTEEHKNRKEVHHFKLFDRLVKVFSIGTSQR